MQVIRFQGPQSREEKNDPPTNLLKSGKHTPGILFLILLKH